MKSDRTAVQDHPTPELTLDGPVPGIPGAIIREVLALPEHLPGGEQVGPYTEAAPGALLFEVPGVARYLMRDGTTIEVAVAAHGDRAAAELFLHGSARGALIHQRGELALNAATLIAPNWKCVAICGPSGFGKSTLAAALCQRGWLLVADEVTRVTWNGSMAVAWPSHDKVKLWHDACEGLGIGSSGLKRVRSGGAATFYLPVRAAVTPAALATVVRLRVDPKLEIIKLPPRECATVLSENTFRHRQLGPLGRRADHAQIVARIARVCWPMTLNGARNATVNELADCLAEAIR